ncbi:Ubiquitin-like protein [Elasticomyces elasticus]|nr:Ubiquitin-like protein [Elasticomyces elasticus]KAK4906026.1 Ubiquitin-like protein [Elasticomyces elasticus]KAK5764029.1 Ubiquitin-like protein [Elasticomyces elasticus]
MSDTGLQSRKFIYSNLGVNNIRLLHLLPGDWNDGIHGVVFEADLQRQNVDYEAVSYTWGEPTRPKHTVHIMSSSSGRIPRTAGNVMEVSEGTFEALRRLRPGKEQVPRTLWIDAIFETLANVHLPFQINQDNVNERNAQVQKMKDIFSGARRVLAYVGESADDSSVLLETMQTSHGSLHPTPNDPVGVLEDLSSTAHGQYVDNSLWRCLEIFLRRRWFRRIWVVQEVVLAKEIRLICGDNHTSWEAFQAAMRAWYPEHTIAEPLPAVLRRTDWVSSGVLQALQTTRMCDATDGRDKLYGIGKLAPYPDAPGFALVRTERDNDAKLGAGLESALRTEYHSLRYTQWSLLQDAVSVGWQIEDPMLLRRGSRDKNGRQYITVGVIVLGTIKEVARPNAARGPRMDRDIGLRSWDCMIRLRRKLHALTARNDHDDAHEVFLDWLSDVDMDFGFAIRGREPGPDYGLFPEGADRSIDSPQWVDDEELLSAADGTSEYDPRVDTKSTFDFRSADNASWDHLKAYQDNVFLDELGIAPLDYGVRMIATRRLMLLDDDTYALGPAEAKVDDIVCVMIGASVPFVIRRETEQEGSAVLVGECWVKSVMQGEAVRSKNNEGYAESFTVSEDFEQRGYRVEELDLF